MPPVAGQDKSLGSFHTHMATQLHERLLALDRLMQGENSLEKGGMCEHWVRSLLKGVLPLRFGVGWGHVAWGDRKLRGTSPLDVIVYDRLNYSPLFFEEDFVVVPPPALLAVIEVKAILAKGSLAERDKACSQLHDVVLRLRSDLPELYPEGAEFPGFVVVFSPLKAGMTNSQHTKYEGTVLGYVEVGRDAASIFVNRQWQSHTTHGFAYWYWQLLEALYGQVLRAPGDTTQRAPTPPNWQAGGVFGDA